MKNSASLYAQKGSPMMNLAIVAILILTAIPAVIFGIAQVLPPLNDGTANTAEARKADPKRTSAAERRAQRKEAREAKKALLAQNSSVQTNVVTIPPEFGGFGLDNDIETMFPGAEFGPGFGPGGMGGFVFGPGAEMGGFGPGFGPGAEMGGFAPQFDGGFGMMPGADMGGFGA